MQKQCDGEFEHHRRFADYMLYIRIHTPRFSIGKVPVCTDSFQINFLKTGALPGPNSNAVMPIFAISTVV